MSFFDAGNATHNDVVGEDVLIHCAGPRHDGSGYFRQTAQGVSATDANEYRLKLHKKMGATAIVAKQLEDVMVEQNIVEGFDVGLEMSGNGAALNQMLSSMRNGGKVALLGIAGPGTVIDWNDVIFKGLTLQGIYGRKMYETWYKMGAMIEAGLDLSPIVTHRYSYKDFEKGFAAMNSGESGKVVLNWLE